MAGSVRRQPRWRPDPANPPANAPGGVLSVGGADLSENSAKTREWACTIADGFGTIDEKSRSSESSVLLQEKQIFGVAVRQLNSLYKEFGPGGSVRP
jgi:hypothetical protein